MSKSNVINEGGKPLSLKVSNRLQKELEAALCLVLYNNIQGTGALVTFPVSNGVTANSFITCKHVLGTNDRSEIKNMTLQFEAERMKLVRILPDWIYRVWNSSQEYYDATIIEFNETGTQSLLSIGAKFLSVDKPLVNQRVVMFQYPSGELSLDGNIIERINGYEVMYHIGADNGSSGSPLLTHDGKVVGMHRRRVEREGTLAALGDERHASDINYIINAYALKRLRFYLII